MKLARLASAAGMDAGAYGEEPVTGFAIDHRKVAPGTVVTINGTDLTTETASADPGAQQLPTKIAGTSVYFNGIPAPLFQTSP